MANPTRKRRLKPQPVVGFGHLQSPSEQSEEPQDSPVVETGPPAKAPAGQREAQGQKESRSSSAPPANVQQEAVLDEPSVGPAKPADVVTSPAARAVAALDMESEERPVRAPSSQAHALVDKTSGQPDQLATQAQPDSTGLSPTQSHREEPLDGSVTGTVAARKRSSSPAGAPSGYFQPRPAELPAPIKQKLASLPPNYLSLYQSFSDAANPAVASAGRNVRLNASLALRLARQTVTDKRRLAAGTRRPALSPSHYIDAALRQARQRPIEVLVEMGQSFRIRTSHEDLPKPNTYTLTSAVGVWIDDLKDELTLTTAHRGLLGHILNACIEAFLDGLEHEAAGSP